MRAIDAVYFQEFINIYKTSQEEQANKGSGLQYFGPKEMQMLLDRIPIIDAEPVRHGQWLEAEEGVFPKYCGKCSECGKTRDKENYCPNSGAKMILEEKP